MDSDWLLVGATGWLSYRRDAARLSSVSGGGGAEEGAEPRAVPDLEPAGHGKPEACETRRRGRVKHELKISQTGEWMKGGANLSSNGIQNEKPVCDKIIEFNFGHVEFEGPTAAEDIQKRWNLKLGREMKQSHGRE